ncbi:XRE family transcriptional regulator [Tianweitania sp.]|uniref:XRE family transcriptional regulator n=1 Tax=Tianweitania sp. TaxID=2021634 RepID=UPI002897AC1C|nr:XRE family transcriptional regulator [Tianweitania sp.]
MGDDRFYETVIPIADRLYDEYLVEIRGEGDMIGHRSFNELRQRTSAERRPCSALATRTLLQKMALHELRRARAKSQVELASDLHVGQPALAKMELRADMYISNLRRYVEALGGKLEITARFPNVFVTIKNFAELSAGEKAAQCGKSSPLATS